MLIATNLLNALSDLDTNKCSKTNEFDIKDFLEFCSNNKDTRHMLRYPDEKEGIFSFYN